MPSHRGGIPAPDQVLNFSAVANGDTQIDLSWDAVDDIDSYELDVSTDGGSNYSAFSTPGALDTSDSHAGLTEVTTRHYRIRAIGPGGEGEYAFVNATTLLAAPANFQANADGSDTITLEWTDTAADEGYELDVSTDGGANYDPLETLADNVFGYTHTPLPASTQHHYRLRKLHSVVGPGPYSFANATTEVAIFAFVAVDQGLSPHSIDVLDASGVLVDSYNITGTWGAVNGRQLVAYHAGINRVLYVAGTKLRSVQWDGTNWTNDTEAYDLGAKTPYAIWVLSLGQVWLVGQEAGTAAWMRWAASGINVDLTWDAPGVDEAGGDIYTHAVIDGANEGHVLVERAAFGGDLRRMVDYASWPASAEWKNETGEITKAFYDTANDRIFYYQTVAGASNDLISVMADSAGAADSVVKTMMAGIGGDDPAGVLIYRHPWLYYSAGGSQHFIRRVEDLGGSWGNDAQWYSAGERVKGLCFAELAI